MRRTVACLLLIGPSLPCLAASLVVEVRDARGSVVSDAVVYAIPEGRLAPSQARTAVMDQKDRRFVPHVLAIQTGTAVMFPNSDNVRHQVYSFSPAKKFQLPLYAGTPPKPIVFDKAGVVALGCNIHDRMSAYIVVVDTPHFGLTENGLVELTDLAAGSYGVRVWFAGMQDEPAAEAVSLTGTERRELKLSTARR
ncbi:MAG TPA: methylamine utilization protein [Vicinamibacteria bacterium]|nr:methylamine utilization protein [Vicinamibacteria bacterium]